MSQINDNQNSEPSILSLKDKYAMYVNQGYQIHKPISHADQL